MQPTCGTSLGSSGKQQLLEDPLEGTEALQEDTTELPPPVTPLRSLPQLPRDQGALRGCV